MTIILETQRLILRKLVLDDLDELFALYSDPEIRKYFPEGVLTLEGTKEELEWHMNDYSDHPELGLWATIHKKTGKFIGRCGLLPWEINGVLEIEVAYLLDSSCPRNTAVPYITRAKTLKLAEKTSHITPPSGFLGQTLDKNFWHQGLATEAATGILTYAFDNLKLSRIICLMHPDNVASQRVAQRLGMTLEGKVDGVAADNFPTYIYSINKPIAP